MCVILQLLVIKTDTSRYNTTEKNLKSWMDFPFLLVKYQLPIGC